MTMPQLEALSQLLGISTEAKACKQKSCLLQLIIKHSFDQDDEVNKTAALAACLKPKPVKLAAAADDITRAVVEFLADDPENKDAVKEAKKDYTKKRIKYLEIIIKDKQTQAKAKATAKAKGKASAKAKTKAKAQAKSQNRRMSHRRRQPTPRANGPQADQHEQSDDDFFIFEAVNQQPHEKLANQRGLPSCHVACKTEPQDDDAAPISNGTPAEHQPQSEEQFWNDIWDAHSDTQLDGLAKHKLACKEEQQDDADAPTMLQTQDTAMHVTPHDEDLDLFLCNHLDSLVDDPGADLGANLFGPGSVTDDASSPHATHEGASSYAGASGGGSSSSNSKPPEDSQGGGNSFTTSKATAAHKNYPSGISKINQRPDVLKQLACPGGMISIDFQAHRFLATLKHDDKQGRSLVPPYHVQSTSKVFGEDWKSALMHCHGWLWRKCERLASLSLKTKPSKVPLQEPGQIADSVFEELAPIVDGLGFKVNYSTKKQGPIRCNSLRLQISSWYQ